MWFGKIMLRSTKFSRIKRTRSNLRFGEPPAQSSLRLAELRGGRAGGNDFNLSQFFKELLVLDSSNSYPLVFEEEGGGLICGET